MKHGVFKTGKVSKESPADKLYRTRFDRVPRFEPYRSRWCMLETLHAAAIKNEDFYAAIIFADARYEAEQAGARF